MYTSQQRINSIKQAVAFGLSARVESQFEKMRNLSLHKLQFKLQNNSLNDYRNMYLLEKRLIS